VIFHDTINIAGKKIYRDSPTFIIAEAGVNHGGDVGTARKLIDIAVSAGADAVKFQAFRTSSLILEGVEKAPYQQKATTMLETQSDMLRKLELLKEQYQFLKEYCESRNIVFLITPFDETSLNELEEIGIDAYKVASTDITNLPFLKKIAKTGKPIILSTGMCYLEEVEAALNEIHPINKNVILLQCTANYPIRDDEANLNILNTYKNAFSVLVGYSDHSEGLGASLFAIPMGAKVIEKHFTLDKSSEGPDHLASLDPGELVDYVKTARKIEEYLGSSVKEVTASEKKTRLSLQKCLVMAKPIKAGEEFTEEHIVAKRTGGNGISPIMYKSIIGRKSSRDYSKNEIIEE